jgi:hypothetical protein
MHTSPSTVRQCLSTITGVSSLVFVMLVLMLVVLLMMLVGIT